MLKIVLRPHSALVLSAALSLGVSAQPVEMPVQVPEVLRVETGLSLAHHSNLFRQPVAASQSVWRALVGVRFEREFSLQRVTAYANAEPIRYVQSPEYDYVGYGVGAQWDWALGRPFFGTLSGRLSRVQTAFETVGASSNLQDVGFARFLGGMRWTQSWSLIAAVDRWSQTNSLATQRAADFSRTGYELGLRYVPARATEFDLVYRTEDGYYPNRQVVGLDGALLGAGIDNVYAQDAALLRVAYRPSDVSRLEGAVGITRRSYETVPQRDFSGVTASLQSIWPLSGAVTMRASLFRTIDSAELLSASYITATGAALRPVWSVASRLNLEGLMSYARQSYDGDPGFVLSGLPVRRDTVSVLGLRLNYELARRVALYGDVQRWQRRSNYDEFDVSDVWFGLGARAAF
jgi:hypothetical protein